MFVKAIVGTNCYRLDMAMKLRLMGSNLLYAFVPFASRFSLRSVSHGSVDTPALNVCDIIKLSPVVLQKK